MIRRRQVSANITGYFLAGIIVAGCGNDATNALQNRAPEIPSNPYPADGGADQVVEITLSWECSDPDGDPLTYDIYFNTLPPPSLADSNLTQPIYDPGTLRKDSVYYWSIVARDDHGHTTVGPIWYFTVQPTVRRIGSYPISSPPTPLFVMGYYVYLGIDDLGLQILNVSERSNPLPIGSYSMPDSPPVDVYVRGNYAYVVNGGSYLKIINVSNPADPVLTSDFEIGGYGENVFVVENYVYVVNGTQLLIIDVTDISLPEIIGSCSAYGFTFRLFVAENYAYISAWLFNSGYVDIIDISDKSNPTRVNVIGEDWYALDIHVAADYAYFAGEDLRIINMADPANPIQIGFWSMSAQAVFVNGDFAYVADSYLGLQILDIRYPDNLSLVGSYNTPGSASDVFCEEEYIYMLDEDSLFVLRYEP